MRMPEKLKPAMFAPCALLAVGGIGGWFAGLFIGKRRSSSAIERKNELYQPLLEYKSRCC